MTPRDPRPCLAPIFPAAGRSLWLLLVVILTIPGFSSEASAAVDAVVVSPASPSNCDEVTIGCTGTISACDYLASAVISGPELIPDWAGPGNAYRTRIVIEVRPDSADQPCVLLSMIHYTRSFQMGRLPIGQHFVTAVEYAYDSNGDVRDSVTASNVFSVGNSAYSCDPCVLLWFGSGCVAKAARGGEGCLGVLLSNSSPVGGVQLTIQLGGFGGTEGITPKSVVPTDRAAGFQVDWEANGSNVSILLYTTTDAVIAKGSGSIVRICYDVDANVPPGSYRVGVLRDRLDPLVANPAGEAMQVCDPYIVPFPTFCVDSTEVGCDLNGDGVADVRDIVQLVRCALVGDACPDTVAARADCNDDGSIDIRDVICCVRKLIHLKRQSMIEPPAVPNPTRIGFDGPASWVSPAAGKAEINVLPAADFGAIDFDVEPAANVRITGARLTMGGGATLEWATRENGVARVLLLRSANGVSQTPFRVTVDFEPLPGGPSSGTLRLHGGQSATWDAAAAPYELTASSTPVLPAPVAAPRIEGARPNPFAASTEIPFTLPSPSRVSVRVYDVTGRLVRTLLDAVQPAGAGRVTWDGRDASGRSAPTGVYFVKLTTPAGERTARTIKMR